MYSPEGSFGGLDVGMKPYLGGGDDVPARRRDSKPSSNPFLGGVDDVPALLVLDWWVPVLWMQLWGEVPVPHPFVDLSARGCRG